MLFLASSEIIFRVAIALLEIHKDELMKRDNFEDIMNYLKNIVPNIDSLTMDKVLKQVSSLLQNHWIAVLDQSNTNNNI